VGAHDDEKNRLSSLSSMLRDNGHENGKDYVLKIDVEGAEWSVFSALDVATLSRFRQIVVELHGLASLSDSEYRQKFNQAILNIRNAHLPIHVHGNNWGVYSIVEGFPVPDVLEVTWVSRSLYSFVRSVEVYPTHLDAPCHPDRPDFFLGSFCFKPID
jgi:hypothetical protein